MHLPLAYYMREGGRAERTGQALTEAWGHYDFQHREPHLNVKNQTLANACRHVQPRQLRTRNRSHDKTR